jgi:hypothetical protein
MPKYVIEPQQHGLIVGSAAATQKRHSGKLILSCA